jgi:hypothetical protein
MCIMDRCNGLDKRIENKIIKINKKEQKTKIKKQGKNKKHRKDRKKHRKDRKKHKKSTITCSLFADPHVVGSNKRHFEAQTVGDWELYNGENLSVHYRGIQMRGWVASVKFGVRLFNDKIYSTDLGFNSLKINGQVRPIQNGRTQISNEGVVIKNGNKLTFSTNQGEEVDFISFGSFFNAYIRTNVKSATGICSQQFNRSYFFGHPQKGKIVKINTNNCANRAVFRRHCRARGLKGGDLRDCVVDRCNGLDKRIENKIIRDNKRERHIKLKVPRIRGRPHQHVIHRVHPPRVHHRPPVHRPRPPVVRPVFRPRPFVPRARPVFRRRGRGDVWLQDSNKKWIDLNYDGTFNYLRDNKINLKIDAQFSNLGKGSVISAVAIQARGKKIVAESDGKVTVNGELVKFDSAIFDFEKNTFNIFKLDGKKGIFEIRGLREDRFSFEYESESKSYMIVVGSLEKHHYGLYAHPRNIAKYQISKNESIFSNYIAFKKLKEVKPTKEQIEGAAKCCDKYEGEKQKECKSDFVRTGECLTYYADPAPKINDN